MSRTAPVVTIRRSAPASWSTSASGATASSPSIGPIETEWSSGTAKRARRSCGEEAAEADRGSGAHVGRPAVERAFDGAPLLRRVGRSGEDPIHKEPVQREPRSIVSHIWRRISRCRREGGDHLADETRVLLVGRDVESVVLERGSGTL